MLPAGDRDLSLSGRRIHQQIPSGRKQRGRSGADPAGGNGLSPHHAVGHRSLCLCAGICQHASGERRDRGAHGGWRMRHRYESFSELGADLRPAGRSGDGRSGRCHSDGDLPLSGADHRRGLYAQAYGEVFLHAGGLQPASNPASSDPEGTSYGGASAGE